MYDVITIGSNTIDAFVYTEKAESISIKTISSEVQFLSYPLGSKLVVNELDFFTGGGGTNTAVSLSRLGLKTAYIGKVGSDTNGQKILNELKTEGIEFLGFECTNPEDKTGYSIILDSLERKRTILTYRGVNDSLAESEIDFKKIDTKWLYASSMLGKSLNTLEKVIDFASSRKIKILLNPNNYLCENGGALLKNILLNTDILVLNYEEASLLVPGNKNTENILKSLKKLGPQRVIITNGAYPIYLLDNDGTFYTVYPMDIKILEVTGAGDSFSSSFLAGIIKTGDVEFSLKLAITNSHSVLQYKGAKNNLLNYDNALRSLNDNSIIIKKGIYK